MAANVQDVKENKCQKLFRQNKLLVLLIFLIVLAIVVGSLLVFVIPAIFRKEARPYRLPTNIIPYEYELEIKPYLIPDDFKFEGQVAIHVACGRKTDSIVLHSKNLEIEESEIRVSSIDEGNEVNVLLTYYDTSNDLLVLRLLDDLKERHRYRIYLKYKGAMKMNEGGFYVTSYQDDKGSVHYVASTHFEPVEARTTFPCFDEPRFKSTFNITLVRWKNMTSLSNMPRYRTEYRDENWEADIYEKSMRMSTYLVAFVFCDYIGRTKGKITVWSPMHRKDDSEFALAVSIKAFEFFQKMLFPSYRGTKLDMVPVTFLPASAMENWGIIIFDEDSLLTQKDTIDDEVTLSEITSTIAHEIAHQWFGNLVTAKWWSDIWLNEGITSYMENLALIELYPEWNRVDPTISEAYDSIQMDCSVAKPIWQTVNNSEQAEESFGGTVYEKGALITRMAHQILGDNVFWRGIRRYLISNEYENVGEADLWRSLTAAQSPDRDRLDMAEIMYSWTHLSGIPVVSINRDYERGTATVSQQSCQSDQEEHKNDLWMIPIKIETKYAANFFNKIIWLKKRNMTIEEMPKDDEWIVVNGDSTGYYLVNYDRENWKLLSDQLILNYEIFDVTQRYKFIKEISELERMGYTEIDVIFQHLLYITEETESSVIYLCTNIIQDHLAFFDDTKHYELFKEYAIYIWEDLYNRFGWKLNDNDTSLGRWEKLVSYSITDILCTLKYEPCVKEALKRYSTLEREKLNMEDRDYLVKWVTVCTATKNITYEEWKTVKDIHFEGELISLDFTLSCSDNEAIIKEKLSLTVFNDTTLNPYILIRILKSNTISFEVFMNFFAKDFKKLVEMGFFSDWRNRRRAFNSINVSRIIKHLKIELSSLLTINTPILEDNPLLPKISEICRALIHKNISEVLSNMNVAIKIVEKLSGVLKDLSGSELEDIKSFLGFLKKRLPAMINKRKTLEKWLETKPWLQDKY